MTLAENIYHHSQNLPEQAAREALDFIEFLEQRYAKNSSLPASSGGAEAFLAAVTRTLPTKPTTLPATTWEERVRRHAGILSDDFPNDINDSDLGVDAPRDSLE